MALDLVQRYNTRDLAVQVDSGARTVLPGTNVSFTTDPVTGAITINASGGTGTVSSVGLAAPTGFTVSGSPVTTTGTLTFSYTAGYVGYTTAEQTKLAGIAPGATANVGTVTSVNHTGSTGLTIGGTNPITSSGTTTFTLSANLQAWSAVTVASKADLNNPIFTGDPRAPTPATADNDTSIATTAFVKAQGYATTVALGSYVLKAGDTMTGTLNGTSMVMSGSVTSGLSFLSSSAAWVGATNGAGTMYMRPNGSGSTTGELQLNPSGDLLMNGTDLYGSGKSIVAFYDTFLRLNPIGGFTSGIYTGTLPLRHDGEVDLQNSGYLTMQGGKRFSRITVSTAAPGALSNGELYLRY